MVIRFVSLQHSTKFIMLTQNLHFHIYIQALKTHMYTHNYTRTHLTVLTAISRCGLM